MRIARAELRTARHFQGLDRLVRFRFDSVPVWPKTGEQDQRKHHRPAEACERDRVGMKAIVSCAHQAARPPLLQACNAPKACPYAVPKARQAEVSADHVTHGLDLCPHAEPDKERGSESDVFRIFPAHKIAMPSAVAAIKEHCNAWGKDAVQEVSGDDAAQQRAGSDKRSSDGCTLCSDTSIRKDRGHMKGCPMYARAGEGEDADHDPEGGTVPDFMPGQTLLVLWRQW